MDKTTVTDGKDLTQSNDEVTFTSETLKNNSKISSKSKMSTSEKKKETTNEDEHGSGAEQLIAGINGDINRQKPSQKKQPKKSTSSNDDGKSPQPPTNSVLNAEMEQNYKNIQRTLDLLKLKTATMGIGSGGQPPKSREDALEKKFEFWETQPVPKLTEDDSTVQDKNEPIHPPMQPEQIPQESLKLPDGFTWVSLNIDKDEEELKELYTLLYENYVEDDDNMFRFNYSTEFLRWVLQPPGWRTEWYAGVRVQKPDGKKGKLVGFISAIPTKIRVYDKEMDTVEINFLCVHKKLRSKRMAPVLISEITRRVRLHGIFQALYTAGVFLPKPIASCRYYHRSLNPKKLIEVSFSHLTRNMTISRTVKLYRLPETTSLEGLRRMESKDIEQVHSLMTEHMKQFDLVPLFTLEEIAHWLLPVPDVVESYVVESKQNKEIIGFFSFYILPSTVMNHKQYKEIRAAYSFYNVPTEKCSLEDLMSDALIIAKNSNLDVFNALDQRDNGQFLSKLKFGRGDGDLHYYLFNWKCPPMKPEKVGVVLQ